MQYSDTSALQGLKQDMYFLLGSDNGTAPDDYSDNDQKRNLNNWYRKAIALWLDATTDWLVSDTSASVNLVAGTRSYQLSAGAGLNISPQNLLKITRVEVSYDGSQYYKATPVAQADIGAALADGDIDTEAGLNDTAQPFYVLRDDYIDIYPKPSANATNGLKVYYQTDITDLTNTTDYPKLPSLFTRYISLGGAYDYAMSRGLPNAGALRQEIEVYAGDIRSFIKERNTDEKFKMTNGTLTNYD